MNQMPLWPADSAHARNTDPETSHEAAASLTSEKIRASQRDVLNLLTAAGPLTDEALVALYERFADQGQLVRQSPSGIRTRRKELERRGEVVATTVRAVLASGRRAIVWRAAGC